MPRLLLWAFLGGVLLNLMPTVLALLVAEAARAARRPEAGCASGPRRRPRASRRLLGSAALALAAHRAGLPAGWGAQLQEPAVAALLAVASALLALNLWGLVEFPLAPAGSPRRARDGTCWPAFHRAARPGLAPADAPGAARLCLRPRAGGGLRRSSPWSASGWRSPTCSSPWPRPRRGRCPRPAPWMPALREGLGFLAGGGTLWLLYALSRQVSPEGLAWIELALLGMALLAWLRHRRTAARVR